MTPFPPYPSACLQAGQREVPLVPSSPLIGREQGQPSWARGNGVASLLICEGGS